MKHRLKTILFMGLFSGVQAQSLLIPMDLKQTDHLKAYGIAFWALERGLNVEWLLNFRGGSFMCPRDAGLEKQCRLRGVHSEPLSADAASYVHGTIESNNMDIIQLEKAPKIAVYTPPDMRPWDDAVTLALTYAEIPYRTVWDEAVLDGKLRDFDWLHLHHEDFTGQYGKFYRNYRSADWYVSQQQAYEADAKRLGYRKVAGLKLAAAQMIRRYVLEGGFLFAMCSATDSYDIALSAEGTDICDSVFDGDPVAAGYAQKIDYRSCLAFEKFEIFTDPMIYEYSDIDTTPLESAAALPSMDDYFTLFDFSAKHDPVPSMLTQDHVSIIRSFMGQTTGFRRDRIKSSAVLLAEKQGTDEVKYIHGNLGKGTWTFLGGHDPEDTRHFVGDKPTDLAFHKNSPGYRLILNNVLFPAARKKEQKT